MAAYIPPHKRHLKEGSSRSPPRILTPTSFPKSLVPTNHSKRGRNFILKYGSNSVSRWFFLGLDNDDDNTLFFKLTRFQPDFPQCQSFVPKIGENTFVLVLDHDHLKEDIEGRRGFIKKNPWAFVASNVKHDFLLAFDRVKTQIRDDNDKHVILKPAFFARFGKVLFHGNVPNEESSSRRSISPEDLVKKLKRSFRTNVSVSFMDYIVTDAVRKLGLEFDPEKEFFHVKVSDSTRPDSNLSCKCTWSKNSQQLELFKIDLNPVRHLVVDVSCLQQKTDLRLMLCMKRAMTDISEDEMKHIKTLISSAILDPEVKGGLRWPLGKESSGYRYNVVGIWHVTKAKTFRGSSIKLKVRHADRFDLSTSSGEVSIEVSVKMPKIISEMEGQTIDEERLGEMLESNLKLIWDTCLCYDAEDVFE